MKAYYVLCTKQKNDSLTHHGIKGQKWGVRRYQNADGSLTAEGKTRYGSLAKGSQIRRITTLEEANNGLPTRHLYVSNNQMDHDIYSKIGHQLPGIQKSNAFKQTKQYVDIGYETTKDLKIMEGSEVLNYLVDNLGPLPISKVVKSAATKEANKFIKKHANMTVKDLYKEASVDSDSHARDAFTSVLGVLSNAALDHLSTEATKKGYDALVDVYDWYNKRGVLKDVQDPLVILKPNESLKVTDIAVRSAK